MTTTHAPRPRPPAELLRSRTGVDATRRPGDVLFRIYLAALFGPVVYFAASDLAAVVAALLGAPFPLTAPDAGGRVAAVLAAGAAAALAAVVHTGVWRGPFLLDRADLSWLFASPLPRRALLRPRLQRAARRHAAAGAATGAVAGSVAATALGGATLPASVAGAIGGCGLGLLGLAGAWWPALRPDRAGRTLWAATAGGGAAGALATAALAVPAAAPLLVWTGPWGWVAAATVAAGGGAIAPAVALLALCAGAAAIAARGVLATAGRGHAEGLARTTGAAAGASAAAYLLDVAAVAEVRREALDALRPSPRMRLPPPRRPVLAIAWRDATSLLRTPGRTLAALAGVATGALVAITGVTVAAPAAPEAAFRGPALVAIGVLAAQAAAGTLVGPLRSALSRPFGHLHLPWSHLRLVRRHLAVPTAVLTTSGALAAGAAATVVDGPGPATAALGAALVAPLLVLGAALQALRPPRAPHDVAESVLSNEYGAFALLLRSWHRMLAPVGVALAATALAHSDLAATTRLTLTLVGAVAATAAGWWRVARKTAPWA